MLLDFNRFIMAIIASPHSEYQLLMQPNYNSTYGASRLSRLLQQLIKTKLAQAFLRLKKPILIGTQLLHRNNQLKKSMVIMGKKFEDYLEFQVHRQNALHSMMLRGCQLLESIQTKRMVKKQYWTAWLSATKSRGHCTSQHQAKKKILEARMQSLGKIVIWRVRCGFLLIKHYSRNNVGYVEKKVLLQRLIATLNNYEIRILHFHFLDKNSDIHSFIFSKQAKRIAFKKLHELAGTTSLLHHYQRQKAIILLSATLSTIISKTYCQVIQAIRYQLLSRPMNPQEYNCPPQALSRLLLNTLKDVIYRYTYVNAFRLIRQKAAKVKWEAQQIFAMTLKQSFNALFRMIAIRKKEILRASFRHIKRQLTKMSAQRHVTDQSFIEVAKAGLQVTGPMIAQKARKLQLRPTNGRSLKIRILDRKMRVLLERSLSHAFWMIQNYASIPSDSVEQLVNNIEVLSKEVEVLIRGI